MENNMHLPDFLIIPSVLVKDEDLRPTDFLIYGVIYWYKRLKLEKCILSNKGFATLLNISERAVQYGLARMDNKKYIKVKYADDKKKVRKEIIPLITMGTNKRSYPNEHLSTPPRTNVHHNNIDLKRKFKNTFNKSTTYSSLIEKPEMQEVLDKNGKLIRYREIIN